MSLSFRIGSRIGSADPFWVQLRESVYQKAQQLGTTLVEIDFDYASAQSQDAQLSLVESLLAQDLDALICPYLPDQLAYHILERGLPIIHLTETDVRHPRFASPLGFYSIAQMVGMYLADLLDCRGHVLAVGGLIASHGEDGRSRLAGVSDALRDFPAMRLSHIPSAWRYERAFPQIEAALPALELPIDAIFGLSDSLALAARDACRAHGLITAHTPVVGINGDPLALAAIAEGEMAATVETSAVDFGTQVIDLACRAAQGLALPAHFSYKPRLVTAQNVAEVAVRKLIAIAEIPNRLVGVNRQRERARLTQLETSLAINRRVGAILDRRQLAREIADLIGTSYGFDMVQLLLLSEAEQVLICEHPQPVAPHMARIPLPAAGLFGQVLATNEWIDIPDTTASQRYSHDPAWPNTRSRVILPVRFGQAVRGLLDLHCYQPAQHTAEELAGLQLLADQVGIAIRNCELYGDALAARTRAEQADQMKTRLLANVSHELRMPLNVIVGYSQSALAALVPADNGLSGDLQQIRRSGEHLIQLSNDLLDLSRAEIGELDIFPEMLDPHSFLSDVFTSMAHTAQSQVSWHLKLPVHLPPLQADPLRLRQLLFNLLGNAAKYTPEGEIELGAEVTLPHLHIWVRDTGTGIPADLQQVVFEPFVSGEPGGHRHGAGLGLAIAQRLVALHRGWISLESSPGRGSTFHVYLPLPNLKAILANDDTADYMYQALHGSDARPATTAALVRRAVAYIQEHYGRNISRQEIAEAVGISQNYLSEIFTRELGLPPWEYLNRYRIKRAKELLRRTDESITAIAARVGFADSAYFSRVFRKQVGRSPRAYRERM